MRTYEIVLDGELTADLSDSVGPLPRREVGGSTILTVPAPHPEALARVLSVLQSLGIGVTALLEVEETPESTSRSAAAPE